VNEKAVAHWGLLCQKKERKKSIIPPVLYPLSSITDAVILILATDIVVK